MSRRSIGVVVAIAALGLAGASVAAVPLLLPVQGVLQDGAGALVADGTFEVTFSLYAGETAETAVWSETWPPAGETCDGAPETCVQLSGGVFNVMLGSHIALSQETMALGQLWLGTSVEGEPELPRRVLGSTPYALRAASAESLACSGCLTVDALSEGARSALAAEAVDAVVAAGLGGGPVDEEDLPPGGLDEVSGGLLTTEFAHTVSSANPPLSIPDHQPVDYLIDTLEVPDLGVAKSLTVFVHLTNSNIGELSVWLQDPNGDSYSLLVPGGPDGVELQTSFPEQTPTLSGDLGVWLGANPAGVWTLNVLDDAYLNNFTDGQLLEWGVQVSVVSNQKVGVQGDLDLQANQLLNPRFHLATEAPMPCAEATEGFFYLDTADRALKVCVDGVYRRISMAVCGDGNIEGDETCDDGDLDSDDGCSSVCAPELGWGCSGQPSVCATNCGDGVTAGAEECDDGAAEGGDGCSGSCQEEVGWTCGVEGCETTCGDGIHVASEEGCDDGNNTDGDGCSATCSVEILSGCADGSEDQIFQTGVMVGCDGAFVRADFETACGTGWHPANPNEYFTYGGKTVQPTTDRWVDTAWTASGQDTSLKNWQGYYDCSNGGGGWDGICQNGDCTWISDASEQCELTFTTHHYGVSHGCHCRGGNPNSSPKGVICVADQNALSRL